jgi:hypothetical protein
MIAGRGEAVRLGADIDPTYKDARGCVEHMDIVAAGIGLPQKVARFDAMAWTIFGGGR